MRKNIVAGNWKMNKTLHEGIELAKEVNSLVAGTRLKCEVVLATPFIHLSEVAKIVDKKKISVAAQDCSSHLSGAYTGEVSAAMVQSTGASHVIIGHSERRAYHGETNATVKDKTNNALTNNLTPIVCIGEVLSERESGNHFNVVKKQVEEGMFHLTPGEFEKVVIAYEPVWAIGTGKTATSDQAQEMHAYIRGLLISRYGAKTADNTTILYGGSCNASNAKELFANTDVDGGLIGGASLKATDFMAIINAL